MRIVAVTWVDAVFDADERSAAFSTPPTVTTYGVLLEANDEFVRVTAERFEDGTCRATTTIPRGMVKRIRTLK